MIISVNTPAEDPILEKEHLTIESLKTPSRDTDESTVDMDYSASAMDSSDSSMSSASTLESIPEARTDTTKFSSSGSPSTTSPSLPRRPSLKSNYSVDDIPVALGRKSFKILPKPDMKQVKAKRSVSIDSFFQPPQENQQHQPQQVRRRRSVSFTDVTIREYDLTLGDNPCVSYGPPITLDWKFEENAPVDLDDYEVNREPRRKMRQMVLSHYQRKNILQHTYGYSEAELNNAKKEAKKFQRQRSVTRAFLNLSKVEEAVESVGRKAKRAVLKRSESV